MDGTGKIVGLFRYPVKSCCGQSADELPLDVAGPEDDRRWMIVDDHGKFITQRAIPAMARIEARFVDNDLLLGMDGVEHVRCSRTGAGEPMQAVVWNDAVACTSAPTVVNEWLSDYLQLPVRLVRMLSVEARLRVKAGRAQPFYASLADSAPLLVVNTRAVAAAMPNVSLAEAIGRFRPNVVVELPSDMSEAEVASLRLGAVSCSFVYPCDRCVVVNTDQRTGERGREPLAWLIKNRAINGKAVMGLRAVHDGPGVLKMGDPVLWRKAADIARP